MVPAFARCRVQCVANRQSDHCIIRVEHEVAQLRNRGRLRHGLGVAELRQHHGCPFEKAPGSLRIGVTVFIGTEQRWQLNDFRHHGLRKFTKRTWTT